MALWTQTAAQILERRNSFLRDLAHGTDITYQEVVTTGGTFDHTTDTLVAGMTSTVSTLYAKSLLIMPIKTLDEDRGDGGKPSHMIVSGGHRLEGVVIDQSIIGRLHIKVPINFQATYLINGQTYKVDRILSSVAIGAKPFWNDVLFTRA